VKTCIETFSRELIRVRLDPPKTSTIFIDLIQFTPGQPDVAPSRQSAGATQSPGAGPSRNGPVHIRPQRPLLPQAPSPSSSAPPLPPWSRPKGAPSPTTSHEPTSVSPSVHALVLAGPGPNASSSSGGSDQNDPLIPFKRKRKQSVIEGPQDNVHVFEVEPGSKRPPSSPSAQRSPPIQRSGLNGSPLTLIVNEPAQALAQNGNGVIKLSPTIQLSPHQSPQSSRNDASRSPVASTSQETDAWKRKAQPVASTSGVRKVRLVFKDPPPPQ